MDLGIPKYRWAYGFQVLCYSQSEYWINLQATLSVPELGTHEEIERCCLHKKIQYFPDIFPIKKLIVYLETISCLQNINAVHGCVCMGTTWILGSRVSSSNSSKQEGDSRPCKSAIFRLSDVNLYTFCQHRILTTVGQKI